MPLRARSVGCVVARPAPGRAVEGSGGRLTFTAPWSPWRPLTDFIWRPDALSWVVGLLAGVAGMLSLTAKKSGALVGVLISVTTVPAAANLAVAVAYGVWHEAAGSALQLLINLCAIVLAGLVTLVVQQLSWNVARRGTRTGRTIPVPRADRVGVTSAATDGDGPTQASR